MFCREFQTLTELHNILHNFNWQHLPNTNIGYHSYFREIRGILKQNATPSFKENDHWMRKGKLARNGKSRVHIKTPSDIAPIWYAEVLQYSRPNIHVGSGGSMHIAFFVWIISKFSESQIV